MPRAAPRAAHAAAAALVDRGARARAAVVLGSRGAARGRGGGGGVAAPAPPGQGTALGEPRRAGASRWGGPWQPG
jgi:hypothetical protein